MTIQVSRLTCNPVRRLHDKMVVLLLTKRLHWIDPGRPSRRDVAGDDGRRDKQKCDCKEDHWIVALTPNNKLRIVRASPNAPTNPTATPSKVNDKP